MRRISFLFASAAALALSACASVDPVTQGRNSHLNPPEIGGRDKLQLGKPMPTSPDQITVEIHDPKKAENRISEIRADGLREAALSLGSQYGYAMRLQEIGGRLEQRSSELSEVFDFNRVVGITPQRAGVVVPPVVSRSFDAWMGDGREASVADEYLSIVRAGRLAPHAPTWRDYLLFTPVTPEKTPRSLLPTDQLEKKAFETWRDQGWNAGVKLADAEFEERIARLQRDYTGMLQYRRLVAVGLMDRLVLADADFGTTVDGDEMRIGSRNVRIVSDASFRGKPQRWEVNNVAARGALVDLPQAGSIK